MNLFEFLNDHTYRLVFLGTMIIGLVAGSLGTFAYLRKQSLMSDVISHAALPGILTAFLLGSMLGLGADNMAYLVVGAIVFGTLAARSAHHIAQKSKIRIDTAMAVALTAFFGVGLLLLRHITNGDYAGKGGIQHYLFGNASTMTQNDIVTSAVIGGISLTLMTLFWKEFAARTFDALHATVMGMPIRLIDALMYLTIVSATVIGVKAVGLVLMVAFVVTPPAAARQWTRTLRGTVALSAGFGAVASGLGAYLSITIGNLPTGPVIVLVLSGIFALSLIFAPRRSMLTVAFMRSRARKKLLRELEAGAA